MSQAYSKPERESDPQALPDLEVFRISESDAKDFSGEDDEPREPGWYYWYCFPGCMPDSDPYGPYSSEQAALTAAQDEAAE